MGVEEADQLQRIIENARSWPLWGANMIGTAQGMTPNVYARAGMYGGSLRDVAKWVAFRESDRNALRQHAHWARDREYRVDPLAQRICGAYSDLLFGEDPDFTAATAADQDKLDEMVEANDLPSELRRWCEEAVSEGEIWWRVYVDRDISDWPIIDSNSRLDTIPLFVGRRIAAVAFFSELFSQEIMVENQPATQVWRHIEIQTDGLTRNLLYKGSLNTVGDRIDLTQQAETAGLPEEWEHGLPVMLAGRIPNKLGRDWRLGISEYQGVADLLMDLNEARSIMAENARNTAKARMVVPASAIDEEGKFDAGKDVVVAESLDESLDGKNSGPYAVLEYTFQAAPLLEYINDLMITILTRCGLAEQFVQGTRGSGGAAQAFTGTALRTRLIPTTLAASGKARFWDDGTPTMLQAMILVSNLPIEKGGTGQSWSSTDKPEMKRSSVLPEDENEEAQRHVMLVQGELESVETGLRELHKDWADEDIELEVARIRADRASGPSFGDDLEELEEEGEPTPPPGTPPEVEPDSLSPAGTGEPGSPIPAPSTKGARQPGVSPGPDGQTPGRRTARVTAGGPR